MSSIGEAGLQQSTSMHAALGAGLDQVSNFQRVAFEQYVRLILPLDGSVFWVKADLLVDQMLYSAYRFNAAALSEVAGSINASKTVVAEGDLHYSTQNTQGEGDSDVINRVAFTSKTLVEGLQNIGPYVMYMAEIDGIKFSFSSRGKLQQNADIYHYVGNAVYASMATQVIDCMEYFDSANVVVSNSLPIFMAMNYYVPQVYEAFGNLTLPIYPSYLVPNNLPPPFATVHIEPSSTTALASAPSLGSTLSHTQLSKDRVKFTVYGERNYNAQDLIDFLYQQSENYDQFGMMGMPILRDEKKTQVELGTIAQKKSFEFDVSYYQTRARDIARQLIASAPVTAQVNHL